MTRREALRALGVGLAATGGMTASADPPARRARRAGLSVRIEDEFAPLRTAVVHDASNVQDIGAAALKPAEQAATERNQPHPESGPVEAAAAVKEVARLRALLEEFKVEILPPVPVDKAPSQLFTRDPLFVVGRTAYLGQFLDDHRHVEMDGLAPIVARLPGIVDLAGDDVVIEGGDVVVLNGAKLILVGQNHNTNEAGLRALTANLRTARARVLPIHHHRLHLDCCLAPLPDGTALIHRHGLSRRAFPTLKKLFRELIPIDDDEASSHLAANLLWLDPKNVVSGGACKKTNELLKSRGFTVHAIDFTNVKRMWGSFRCVVCPLRRG